jgi:hypothetical protein
LLVSTGSILTLAGAQDTAIRCKAPTDERRIAQFADMHHQVPHVVRKARGAIGQHKACAHFRIQAAKLSNGRSDVPLPETERSDHTQMPRHCAASRRECIGQVTDVIADPARVYRKQLALVGEHHAPARPVD